tara:strand:+ start:34123 stop:35481 length:1359 start_codon:yes stop_codon:yes gene_type:complete
MHKNNEEIQHNETDGNVSESQSNNEIKAKDNSSSENDSDKSQRYNPGDDITFVRVRFPGNSRSFPFVTGTRVFSYGQKVVAMSDRGMDVGYINSFPHTVKFEKNMLPLKSISKEATESDLAEQRKNVDKQKEAESLCNKMVRDLKLDMTITHVEIIGFGKKMVFYFNAPSRVDFRDLVKNLVSELKMRIELRQISVRDRAAAVGSIGACGLATCCSSFLKNYGNVTIKMAKNQNLALIPSKINGVCGQLKCCIRYEDDVYSNKRQNLPREGNFIKVANGDKGKVLRLHILLERFEMITDQGQIRKYARNQFDPKAKLPEGWKFPSTFKHVVNETSTTIGADQESDERALAFLQNMTEEERSQANLDALKGENKIFDKIQDSFSSIDQEDEENNEDQASAPKKNEQKKEATAKSPEENKKPPRKNNRNRNRNRNKNRPKGQNNKNDQAQKKDS